MKNFIYSVLTIVVIFCISYPQLFSISSTILLDIIILCFWIFLLLTKKEYSLLFCFIGYIHPFLGIEGSKLDDGLSLSILFIVLLVLSCIILKTWEVTLKSNSKAGKFIWIFILYQLLISVIPNLLTGHLSLAVLLTEKDQFLGLLLFFPGYYLGMKYYTNSIMFLIYFGLIFTVFYYLVLFKVFTFVELTSTFVVTGSEEVARYGLETRQIVKMFIYAIPIAFLFKFKLKSIFVFVGISCYLFMILSFARNELIYTTLGILLTIFLITKYELLGKSFLLWFLLFTVLIISGSLIIVSNLLPGFDIIAAFNVTANASKDKSSFFTLDHRFNEIVPNQINLLFSSIKNLVLGVGYDDIWRKNVLTSKDLGIWDVPITGTLTKFGIIGFSIYMAIYTQIFKGIFHFLKLLKQLKSKILLRPNFIEYAFTIVLTSYFITSMIMRTYYVTWELTITILMVEFSFMLGLLLAGVQKFTDEASNIKIIE